MQESAPILIYDYTLLNVALSRSSSAVDLWVISDDSPSHCSVVNKANKILGFIYKQSCLSILIGLYFALVRPILEYVASCLC